MRRKTPIAPSNSKITGGEKKALKRDAMQLAELIYDVFKEQQSSDKIIDGQNNAQQLSED